MHVVVFGANGKVGSIVVAKLLENGHRVTAFVYGRNSFRAHPKLTMFQGNVKQASDVQQALKGAEAVISTLGSWGTKTKDILATGMQVIIPAMQSQGVSRIVSLTGSAAQAPHDHWGITSKLSRQLLVLVAPKILKDGEDHIQLLNKSTLDWTVVRSPIMNELGNDTYSLTSKLPGLFETINRHAVAQAIIDQLEDDTFICQAPHIHRK